MEFIQIVHKPVYAQRPYGGLRSPYNEVHPGCSLLCNHPTAPTHHRSLLTLTRASWVNNNFKLELWASVQNYPWGKNKKCDIIS